MKKDISILFLGKKNDAYTQKALDFCLQNSSNVTAHLGTWGDPRPKDFSSWNGDYIISFLSRWIIPESLLKMARIAAINFHPAPPEYPGIGCNNFALYENAKLYGTTCHHMDPKVDTGAIIAVKRFPISPDDTVSSLLEKTYTHQLELFYEILTHIVSEKKLESSSEKWTRAPYTRQEFNELCRLTPDMSKEELSKRIRATNFGTWKPTIELHGFIFELKTK